MQASPCFFITVKFPLAGSHRFPYNHVVQDHCRGVPQSNPQCWGSWLSSLGSHFPVEKPENQRHLSIKLYWPRGRQRGEGAAASLTLLMQSSLVSVVHGVLQPHPHILGFSLWCLVLEQMLLVLLRSEIRNLLCCHLADISLVFCVSWLWLYLSECRSLSKLSKLYT